MVCAIFIWGTFLFIVRCFGVNYYSRAGVQITRADNNHRYSFHSTIIKYNKYNFNLHKTSMHRREASWLISNLQQLIIFSIVKKPKNILEMELEMTGVDSNERMILEMSGIHLQLPNFRSTSSDIYYKLRSFLISSLLLTKIIGQRLPLWSMYEQYRYKASSGLEPRRPSGTLDRLALWWSSRWTLMLHALYLISLIQISSYFGFAFTLDDENFRSKL